MHTFLNPVGRQPALVMRAWPASTARLLVAMVATALVSPAAVAQTWNQTTAGTGYSWATTANWTNSTVPNGADAAASLTNNISGNQTISLGGSVTLGSLALGDSDSSNSFTLQDGTGGSLLFDVTSGFATISRTAGNSGDTISATITLADDLSIATSAANSFTLSGAIGETGGARSVTKSGTGTVAFGGASANTYTGLTTVSGGTLSLNKTSGNAIGGNLSITNGSVTWANTSNTNMIPDTASVTISGSASYLNTNAALANLATTSETITNLTMTGGGFIMGSAGSVWSVTGTGAFTGGSGNTFFVNASAGRISFGALQLTNMTGTTVGASNSFGVNGSSATSATVGAGGLTLDNSNVVLRV